MNARCRDCSAPPERGAGLPAPPHEPARGVEQGGRRPALVVQNNRGNEHSSYTVVVAISSAPLPRTYPFTVPLAQGEGNLPRAGHVNCAQLLTIDQGRLEGRLGTLSPDIMR